MASQSSEISLELNEFILEETHNRKSIEIGFTPTFKSADIDTFLKTLSLHADLKLIELLCEFINFNVFLRSMCNMSETSIASSPCARQLIHEEYRSVY